MAFQPIFDMTTGRVFAQEALLRGKDGRSAFEMLSLVDAENMYSFDQTCRTTAIEVAAGLGLTASLSINFMPNAVYEPQTCIQRTLWAADSVGFPAENIIFEFTEGEVVRDKGHLKNIIESYRQMGFRTAIDDFGAGFSGLGLIADVVPNIIKIDRELVSGIDRDHVRRAIVRALCGLCDELGVMVVAEGIETQAELETLRDLGIALMQGYLLGRPQFEGLLHEPQAQPAVAA
ncbi:EAL domain-containing protein [Rhodobacteraceae bacterium MCCB 386]|nr:EAL domain-containing protein [Roseitranquillus sediminis]